MKIICFDAEFANEKGFPEEILELSIWQADALGPEANNRQIFHQYIRPAKHRRWPHAQQVHHISPEMVAGKPVFAHWRNQIQKIIDDADCLVGFAIENDITALQREGILRLSDKPAVDVRDLHWLQNTRHEGMDLNARKNLASTAADLGVEFSESLAHGADYDTRVTLACAQQLFEAFRASELSGAPDTELLAHYLSRWDEERESFLRDYARGWIALVRWREGFRIKVSRNKPKDSDNLELAIPVNARYRGVDEIDARFDKRRAPFDPHVYLLSKTDIQWMQNYTNEYDGNEPLHRRMADLRAVAAKGLGNLGRMR